MIKKERHRRYRELNRDKLKQREGSIIFKTNKDKLPLILAGDFNVNFANDESMPLIMFRKKEN